MNQCYTQQINLYNHCGDKMVRSARQYRGRLPRLILFGLVSTLALAFILTSTWMFQRMDEDLENQVQVTLTQPLPIDPSGPLNTPTESYQYAPNLLSNSSKVKALSLINLVSFPHLQRTEFSPIKLKNACSRGMLTDLGKAFISMCGSILTESGSVVLWVDWPCPHPCPSRCGDLYNRFFAQSNKKVSEISPEIFVPKRNVTVVHTETLVPILFYWGHAFPHVIKDVLPRITYALDFLSTNPEAKLLLDDGEPVHRLLEVLGIPESRVIFTSYHTPDSRSLYESTLQVIYSADRIVLPHCWPGPAVSGMYSHNMYEAARDAMLKNSRALKSPQNFVVYVSRDGGFNSMKRRIDNEAEILGATRAAIKDVNSRLNGINPFELIVLNGKSLTLRQSLDTFHRAALVMGPHGGGFYNLIAARPGTRVLEWVPQDYGREEVGRFSRKLALDYAGFVKKGMLRSHSFGNLSTLWVASLVKNALAPSLFARPTVPAGFFKA